MSATDQKSTGQKFRAVFLAVVMVLSMVAMSTAFVGSVGANVPANASATDVTAEGLDTTVVDDTAAVEVSHNDSEELTEIALYDADGNQVVNFDSNDDSTTNGLDSVQNSSAGNTTFVLNVTELNSNDYSVGTGTVYAASESASGPFGSGINGNDVVTDSKFQEEADIQIDGLVVTDFSFPQVAANATTQTAEVTVENLGSNTVEQNVSVVISDDLNDAGGLQLNDSNTFNQTLTAVENLSVNAGNSQTVTVGVDTGTLPNATQHGNRTAYEIAGFTSGSPFSGTTQNLFVGADTGGSASITAVDPNSNPKTAEDGEMKLFLQPQNTPLNSEVLVGTKDTNDNGVATFNDLATGSSSSSGVTYRATFDPDLNTESSTNTTVTLFEPDDTSQSSSVTVRSVLEPEAFGVGAFDTDSQEIVGDSRTLFGDGEFDNQGEFAVFAQTQASNDNGSAQPVNQDVTVTLTVENGTSSPLRFVDPANAGENATQIQVTITPSSPVANVDNNASTGVYSYETFSVTADNASSDTLTEPITTEDFNATTPDIGDRTVDVDPGVTATSDNNIASVGGQELQNSVSYVLRGDDVITGEVRDGVSGEPLEDITVWVTYEGQGDRSFEFVNNTFQTSNGEPFLTTTSASDGSYTIRGLAGNNQNFTVRAYSDDNQLYNRLNKSGTPVEGPVTQGAIAHEQEQQTGPNTGDSVTHDIPLFEEEIEFEYRLNATVADGNGEQAKSVEVPQQGQRTVEVTVEQRPVDSPGEFVPADDGQEITLDLVENPDLPSTVGELDGTTLETSNGTVETTFTAFEAGSGTVNVTAETENDDGTTAETTAGEQAQIEVFGTATITGDVVNEDSENLPNATVELYEGADTSGTPVVTDRTGSQGSYAFTQIDGEPIQTGGVFTARAVDEEGNSETRQFGPLQAGTNDGDIVIVGGVPGEIESANFQLDLVSGPTTIAQNQSYSATLNVTNTGGAAGTQTISYVLEDGAGDSTGIEASQEVSLDAGNSTEVEFGPVAADTTADLATGDYTHTFTSDEDEVRVDVEVQAEETDGAAPLTPEERVLTIAGVENASQLDQDDVSNVITRLNRDETVNGVTVDQDDVSNTITLFEREN